MKTPRHWIVVAMVLLIPGLLWSEETTPEQRTDARRRAIERDTSPGLLWPAEMTAEQQEARRREIEHLHEIQNAIMGRREGQKAPESARSLQIFTLRYQQPDRLARILETLIPTVEASIAEDEASQQLVVAASPERMVQIERVIEQLDVAPPARSDVPQMLYRIYMLELPPEHENLRPFAMELEGTGQITSAQLLGIAQEAGMKIESLSQEPQDETWQKWELSVSGRAASNEAAKRMLEKIPESRIKRFQWHGEPAIPPTTQVAKLPAELGKHIHQLLGANAQTVGYWFGNLSVPGKARAPIGPWSFEMSVERKTQDSQVELEISVTHLLPSGEIWEILGNTVRSHITKPVIIGYNRESHGTRTMGALVIVPQESPDL